MRQHRTTRRIAAAAIALSLALAPAALGPGSADAKPSGGGGAAKCDPGMIVTVTIGTQTSTYVCNKKGKFVKVLTRVAGGSSDVVAHAPASQEAVR